MSYQQNSIQNHDLLIDSKSFESVTVFKYLRTAVTNESFIHKVLKNRLNSGNACYHSVKNLKIFFLPIPSLSFYRLFCRGVKLGLSHKGKNAD
jgi:hypothetical protein